MPTKIKLFFTLIPIVAVVSVFSFFDVFGGVRSANFSNALKPLPPPEEDVDQDGLSNTDESYWNTDFQNPDTDSDGYLDGEEVASRHDPTKPAPNDNLLNINLTQNMANLAAAGLVEGSLKPDHPEYAKSLASVVLSVVNDGLQSFTPIIDPSKIKLVDPTKENQINYLNSLEGIWRDFFKTFGSEVNGLESDMFLSRTGDLDNQKLVDFFTSKKTGFEFVAANWTGLAVPTNWKTEHVNFLNLILGMVEINKSFIENKNDPIRATMAFVLMRNLTEDIPIVVKSFQTKADNENLSHLSLFQ